MTAVRVLIVDDHALIRAGLRAVLAVEPDLQVVGDVGDGAAAVREVAREDPDVVLMDVRMPVLDGISATARILAATDRSKVLVLTTFGDDDSVLAALRAGAAGFLLKRSPPEEIVESIRTAHRGESLVLPARTRDLVARTSRPDRQAARALAVLTPRERDVLQLVARGLDNGTIADTLTIGRETVKTHLTAVYGKLGVRHRAQAVVAAYEGGLVRPGDGA